MRFFCVYCAANKNQLGNVREAGAPTQTQISHQELANSMLYYLALMTEARIRRFEVLIANI